MSGGGKGAGKRIEKLAVVTGANRGIGFEIVKSLARRSDFRVVLTARSMDRGQDAMRDLQDLGMQAEFQLLDVTDLANVTDVAKSLRERFGGIDLVIQNAGLAFKGDSFDFNVASMTVAVNYFGVRHVLDQFLPHMRDDGRIVVVSSRVGELRRLSPDLRKRLSPPPSLEFVDETMRTFVRAVGDGTYLRLGFPKNAYTVSKLGATLATYLYAQIPDYRERGILINACCPGWCRTDMGGVDAPRSAEEGADTPIFLATAPARNLNFASGRMWGERKVVDIWGGESFS